MSYRLLRQLIRETLLNEGVYDPGIFKAVFMAGGPGSGKSFIASEIFGGDPKTRTRTMTSSGLKLVNSDPAFEHFLKKVGVDPGDLGSMPPEEFKKVTTGADSPRGKAKNIRNKQEKQWMEGKLGIIVDGTGDDYEKIKSKVLAVQDAGYDAYMIFVNTTLEVAQERNANRDRKLPADLVEDIWRDVQKNLGQFQGLFGAESFTIVDNTEHGPLDADVLSAVNSYIRRPIKNIIGKKWIEDALGEKGPAAKLPKKKS